MPLRAFCAVWRCFCALCPCVARRLLLCCCSAFLGICCGFAALLLGVCCCSSPAAGGAFCVRITSGRVSLLCRRAAFRRSLRPWVSVRRAADDRGADSVRRLSLERARRLCWGAGVAGVLPRGRGPRARVSGAGARRCRKKSGPFLKSVRTEFSRRFLGPTLNLRRLETMILKLRKLKKLKIFPIRAHTKSF